MREAGIVEVVAGEYVLLEGLLLRRAVEVRIREIVLYA